MKIRLLSDVHREFGDLNVPAMEQDQNSTLVLAGDIDIGLCAIDWILDLAARFKHVVYVMGNHEAYRQDLSILQARWATVPLPENVHVLQNRSIVLDGVKFVGTPLWSDFDNESYRVMQACKKGVSDFTGLVKYQNQRFTVWDHVRLFKQSKQFLQEELMAEKTQPVVVVTHWLPSWSLVDPKYVGSVLNGFYASNLDSLIPYADVWLHGHTHESIDRYLGDTRIVCNPRGYDGVELNPNFDPFKIIEIG